MSLRTEQLKHGETVRTTRRFPFVLMCDAVTSPANAGGLIRLADAFGLNSIIFSRCQLNLNSNRLKRNSRTAENHIKIDIVDESETIITDLKAKGYLLIGLELTHGSMPIDKFHLNFADKIALVVGGERHGIQEQTLQEVDQVIHIPMQGNNSSMNVTHAAAIAIYELNKQQADEAGI